MRVIFSIVLILGLISCNEDEFYTPPCVNGDCIATFEFGEYKDSNGYTHVNLNWNGEYLPYFNIETRANPTSPIYRYNGRAFVTARFESDTYWEIGNQITYRIDYYNPFESDRTSTGNILPTKSEDVVLDLFKGAIVNIAQTTELYYTPTSNELELYTKRSVGPFPIEMKGDTLILYAKVFWDALPYLVTNIYELPIIIE